LSGSLALDFFYGVGVDNKQTLKILLHVSVLGCKCLSNDACGHSQSPLYYKKQRIFVYPPQLTLGSFYGLLTLINGKPIPHTLTYNVVSSQIAAVL
jgi:hypothetical protein